MNRKKGALLLVVLVVVLVVAILSIPIINKLRINTDVTYDSVIDNKADKIAYAGFLALQKYIIENKSDFVTSLRSEPTLTEVYEFDLVYNINGDTRRVSVEAHTPIFDGTDLASITLTSKVTFGEDEGSFENTINFNTGSAPGKILFPNYPHYILSRSLTGDPTNDLVHNFDGVHRDGLFTRLYYAGVFEEDYSPSTKFAEGKNLIPKVATTNHLTWLENNSNFIKLGTYNANYTMRNFHINDAINQLVDKEASIPKAERNALNVVYVEFTSNTTGSNASSKVLEINETKTPTTEPIKNLKNTKKINFDLTNLGNGVDETDFILITNGTLRLPTYFGGSISSSDNGTYEIFEFNINGGNVYLIANKLIFSGVSNLYPHHFAIVHDIGNSHEDVAPQLTFASTSADQPLTNFYYYFGAMENTFLYFPYATSYFNFYHNYSTVNFEKPRASGGIVMGQLNRDAATFNNSHDYESANYHRSYHTHVEWRGKLEYMGFFVD